MNILQLPAPKVQPLDRWKWLNEVTSADCLTHVAVLVAHTLALHMKADLTDCFPSQPLIARKAHLAESSVKRGIKSLVKHGFLKVDKVRNEGRVWAKSVYIACFPGNVTPLLNATQRDSTMADEGSIRPPLGFPQTPTRVLLDPLDRPIRPTNQIPNQITKQSLNRISRKEDALQKAIQEKDKAEEKRKAEEVLREGEKRRIRIAAEHLGVPAMPLGAARSLWAEEVGKMTQLKPSRVIELMGAV